VLINTGAQMGPRKLRLLRLVQQRRENHGVVYQRTPPGARARPEALRDMKPYMKA
jgi:hypothetical protein